MGRLGSIYAVNERRKRSCSWCDRMLMKLGVPGNFRKRGNGKGDVRGVEKAVCDIKLGKSGFWMARGGSQADSKETIHTLM